MSRDVVQVTQGTLYPALHRLENRGFLAADWKPSDTGRDAKFYKLTRKGRAHLEAEAASWERLTGAIASDPEHRERRGVMTWWRRAHQPQSARDAARRRAARSLRSPRRATSSQQATTDGEARRMARLEFGGLDQVKEACRDARGTRWVDETAQDVRYGLARLSQESGIRHRRGADARAWRRRQPRHLQRRRRAAAAAAAGAGRLESRHPDAMASGQLERAFLVSANSSLCPIDPICSRRSAASAARRSMLVRLKPSSRLAPPGSAASYFDTLQLTPVAGRLLTPADDQPGAAPPARDLARLLEAAIRRRSTTSSAQPALIEGQPVPIVGITPARFSRRHRR